MDLKTSKKSVLSGFTLLGWSLLHIQLTISNLAPTSLLTLTRVLVVLVDWKG